MRRLIPTLFALVALLLVAVHPAAMASARAAAPEAPAAAAAAPCHGAEAAPKVEAHKAGKQSGKAVADCCADGRCSACTPLVAFFRAVPAQLLSFLRAVLEAPARAAVPLRLADARERPPKPVA